MQLMDVDVKVYAHDPLNPGFGYQVAVQRLDGKVKRYDFDTAKEALKFGAVVLNGFAAEAK